MKSKKETVKFEAPVLDLEKFKYFMDRDYFAFFHYSEHAFAKDMYDKIGYKQPVIHDCSDTEFITWKAAGEMSNYGDPLTPIKVYVLDKGTHLKDSKYQKGMIRFIAYTIDDGSMGFWYDIKSDEDTKELFIKIKEWLVLNDEMPNIKRFERDFAKLGIEKFDHF